MIVIRINDNEVQVPASWQDCTYRQCCDLIKAESIRQRIAMFAPGNLSKSSAELMADILVFTEFPEMALMYAVEFTEPLDIGERSYGDLEAAKLAIQANTNRLLSMGRLIQIYYGEDVSDQPLAVAIGKGAYIMSKMDEFLSHYKELYNYEPTVEEMRAGVDRMNQFGFMGTAIQMARKYAVTHDTILSWPAREVYHTLLYDKIQSDVARDYQQQFK